MSTHRPLALLPGLLTAAVLLASPGPAAAVDADAAQSLARRSNCLKCHSVDKKKDAPPWKEVAAKLRGKPGARDQMITHITTGPKVKSSDGTEEEHPIIKSKNKDEIKNLVDWILSL